MDDGVFRHKCTEDDCPRIVLFDDEPKCFQHSPDSGSSMRGYSAKREADRLAELAGFKDFGAAKQQYEVIQNLMNQVGSH